MSTVRKEDFDFILDKSGEFVEVLQMFNASKEIGNRGHQFPAAFLMKVNNLMKRDLIKFCILKIDLHAPLVDFTLIYHAFNKI